MVSFSIKQIFFTKDAIDLP